MLLSTTAPEPGQLVEVRRRQWIVADVDAAAVAPELPRQNLVKLASIDEDGLGEEIEVVWELEPGAHVIERAGLPSLTDLDDAEALEAFLSWKHGKTCAIYQPCSGVNLKDAEDYRRNIQRLFQNQGFKNAMQSDAAIKNLSDAEWRALFKDFVVPVLAIPGWNRIG